MINFRRRFKSESQYCPLRSWDTNPRRLLGQCLVHKLVAFMQTDLCFWLQFLQRRHTSDVVEMRMRQGNCLQRETASLELLDDSFCLVTGSDADSCFGFFTADDTSVLLKCSHCDFFDDHYFLCLLLSALSLCFRASKPVAYY